MSKTNFAKDQLKSLVERIERLEEEKAAQSADIKEVYAEAKGHGFDVKILRKVVRIRKMDAAERSSEEEMLDLYLSAVGSGREARAGSGQPGQLGNGVAHRRIRFQPDRNGAAGRIAPEPDFGSLRIAGVRQPAIRRLAARSQRRDPALEGGHRSAADFERLKPAGVLARIERQDITAPAVEDLGRSGTLPLGGCAGRE